MKLEIGKLYKMLRSGGMFWDCQNNKLAVQNKDNIVVFLGKNRFLDVSKNLIISGPANLAKEPNLYLYLYS